MKKIIALVLTVIIIVLITTLVLCFNHTSEHKNDIGTPTKESESYTTTEENIPISNDENTSIDDESSHGVENNNEIKVANEKLTDFDLSFLKMEQGEKNLIYSPLSIRYALKMLEEATEGESKEQITKLVGDYTPTKYENNENMSLANSLWIKSDFKDNVKQSYIDTLNTKYAAELKFDDFENANNINNWIKEKTLSIIPQMLSDDDVKSLQFSLINALAIDMEWKQKFLTFYDDDENMNWFVDYPHETINSDGDIRLRLYFHGRIT